MAERKNIIIYLGRNAIQIWKGMAEFTNFARSVVTSFRALRYLRFRSIFNIIVIQTKFTGIDALPFVFFIALVIGGTVIIQATTNLPKFGVEGFIGNLLVIIVARELGPLITALIVVSRSGSAIAAEIATQTWSREILSLELLGIDTKLYIVFPRIIAATLSIFSLIIIFDAVAFFGGYLLSRTVVYIPADVFLQNLVDSFKAEDFLATIIKAVVYGILVPLICCYYGFKPRSKFEIPIFVSRAVIRTLSIIFIINAVISVLFYL